MIHSKSDNIVQEIWDGCDCSKIAKNTTVLMKYENVQNVGNTTVSNVNLLGKQI